MISTKIATPCLLILKIWSFDESLVTLASLGEKFALILNLNFKKTWSETPLFFRDGLDSSSIIWDSR